MEELTGEDFRQYLDLMLKSSTNMCRMADKIGDRITVGIVSACSIISMYGDEDDKKELVLLLIPLMEKIRVNMDHKKKNPETRLRKWVCKDKNCSHEVTAQLCPEPSRWDSGHICHFEEVTP